MKTVLLNIKRFIETTTKFNKWVKISKIYRQIYFHKTLFTNPSFST